VTTNAESVATVKPQVSTAIPSAIFQAPDYEAAHRWSTDAYVDEVTDILREAARVGLTEAMWLTKPGKPLQSISSRGIARHVLQLLVESDSNARAWMAVEHLQPELGQVVWCIRRMIASDMRIQAGHSVSALKARVREFTGLEQAGG
jgi:hypothetical protein